MRPSFPPQQPQDMPLVPAPRCSTSTLEARLPHVLRQLDGWEQPALEQLAYGLVTTVGREQEERLRAVSWALIQLRRTQATTYRHRRHSLPPLPEPTVLNDELLRQARALAFPLGAAVTVLGERHVGRIVQRRFHCDTPHGLPVPWYVVAAPTLGLSRAHGSDELEPAPSCLCARLPRPRPCNLTCHRTVPAFIPPSTTRTAHGA